MLDLAVLGGTVVTPLSSFRAHVYLHEGRVAAVSTERLPAREVVDAAGLHVLPGMVDAHVHFMDPGATDREDFITGSAAAAAGGVTTVIEHTHAHPVCDAAALRAKAAHLARRSLVDFGLAAHVLPDRLQEVPEVWAAGALYLKVFTCTTHGIAGLSAADLLHVFRTAAAHGAICLVHCEDDAITAFAERELRAAGRRDFAVIPLWRSREAEWTAAATVALLARLTGARVVVAHASNPQTVELAGRERRRGGAVWVESCPQYFYLREDEVERLGPFRKFTPPARARSADDERAMWALLRGGEIAYVATDHAPATRAQKQDGDIWQVHFGLPGVETTLSLLLQAVHEGHLTLPRLVEAVAETPARLYGLYPRKGTLQPGADADLVLVDMSQERVLRDEEILSKAGWTPYAGRRVRGRPVATFVRGRRVAADGRPVGEPGWGQWLRRVPAL
ncbi:MAG: dihydroorotase family protein [Armatimonadota bacterium]|nr:dihydroorotase family protein [Armatimonadota bacterium]MDR7450608.1 dihydroorotase family protein [Armatimonadota bacterium]MDR7466259.1 dihydroorotase family protein [Armatimonadota bacterium]MDR7492980.1 dihydroorotase family protein [Armatimonadota bacterium]MDR7498263.1 dihydroorotase family protein [Armatimonadota bacterium]